MKSKLGALAFLAGVYLSSLTVGTVIFFISLWTPVMKNNNDLFFRAGLLMLATTILLITFLSLIKLKFQRQSSRFTYRDILIICLLFFFLNWNIYGIIPFNVSRSNSIIILNYLYQNQGSPQSKENIKAYTEKKYFDEYDSVGIRLHEQLVAGNIAEKEGVYTITNRGVLIADIFRGVSNLYNIKNNFLNSSATNKE